MHTVLSRDRLPHTEGHAGADCAGRGVPAYLVRLPCGPDDDAPQQVLREAASAGSTAPPAGSNIISIVFLYPHVDGGGLVDGVLPCECVCVANADGGRGKVKVVLDTHAGDRGGLLLLPVRAGATAAGGGG